MDGHREPGKTLHQQIEGDHAYRDEPPQHDPNPEPTDDHPARGGDAGNTHNMNDNEPVQEVERYDTGVSITAELKRGTGTRDQDKITVKVKRRDYDEARAEMDGALNDLRRWSDEARDIQPDADGGGD